MEGRLLTFLQLADKGKRALPKQTTTTTLEWLPLLAFGGRLIYLIL